VLAVADAFDSMTSTRSYRGARPTDEAIAELRKWSGTQFDPAFVDAFVAAIKRVGWQRPEAPVIAADEVNIAAQDHDDPSAPIRVSDSL
jgi:HD-GYP domain-containing protein (c-di-GMP phosphodiesterase class II)